jgi:phosphoglycolate phosphatase-like HAD superfamily hydrolase
MEHTYLQSWSDGRSKQAILAFVERTVTPGSAGYVAPRERVAVFDNDGTLWCERPLPIQADFLLKRLRELAELDPALRAWEPYRAAIEQDYEWLAQAITRHYEGQDDDLKRMSAGLMSAYAGSTVEQFEAYACAFMRAAEHPLLHRPYLQCAYRPMLELLRFLESQGFSNYIVSGGGRDFVRAIVEDVYMLGRERVIGSTVALGFSDHDGTTEIVHEAQLGLLDDGPGKPVQIWSTIGRRPIFACGNANGDVAMLRFCDQRAGTSMCMVLRHDDAEREYAYRASAEQLLRCAEKYGWVTVSMAEDWKTVFASC